MNLHTSNKKLTKPYWNPYYAGIGMGFVLLSTFLIMGRGLGASGGFTSIATYIVEVISHDHAVNNEVFSAYANNGGRGILSAWLVFELIGIFVGGFISALLAKRLKVGIDKGDSVSKRSRLMLAFTGGALMGFAAKIARGCTSGLALTGGALLSVGGWTFMMSFFVGGFLAAGLFRRLWS